MAIIDLYSKRQKEIRGDVPDIYTYDTIPETLKVQIIHIWNDTLGGEAEYSFKHYGTKLAYTGIVEVLCREYGVFTLAGSTDHYGNRQFQLELTSFFLEQCDCEKILDVVELTFRMIDRHTREYGYLRRDNASKKADAAIEDLNVRFREHGVGYRFEEGSIVRIDSELIHSEIVKPALILLRSSEYSGAQAEFLKAQEHYRHGRTKEAMTECLKSFESVMKTICNKRNWVFDPNATSKPLIQILFDKGLIPTFWTQHFSSLRSMLESGVPTARNKLSGHGQGSNIVAVPNHLAAYVLHQTAAAIQFLVESEKALP